ncbi:MAG: TraB/GumN family protein [Thermodesulfobacteriota bacterium]
MPFSLFGEKKLKMVWEVTKDGRRSFLIGTAHFFPYSFKKSLTQLLNQSRTALFEGPLDEASQAEVVRAGCRGGEAARLLSGLDQAAIARLAAMLAPVDLIKRTVCCFKSLTGLEEEIVRNAIAGLKSWMAFFSIYSGYLRGQGWKHSVDMEAYRLAGSLHLEIVFMETIQEQIEVLDSLSETQIMDFLRRADQWPEFTRRFVKWYLDGELDELWRNPSGFPTRNPRVIDRRDAVFFERMRSYLERGAAAVFVGVPHVKGIGNLLEADSFSIKQVI